MRLRNSFREETRLGQICYQETLTPTNQNNKLPAESLQINVDRSGTVGGHLRQLNCNYLLTPMAWRVSTKKWRPSGAHPRVSHPTQLLASKKLNKFNWKNAFFLFLNRITEIVISCSHPWFKAFIFNDFIKFFKLLSAFYQAKCIIVVYPFFRFVTSSDEE